MKRMGKKQELLRNFRIFTSIAFTSCVMGTWEILLTSTSAALWAGGLAGLFWQLIWCYAGQTFIVLSLCEMSSSTYPVEIKDDQGHVADNFQVAPTAGGQYHWV